VTLQSNQHPEPNQIGISPQRGLHIWPAQLCVWGERAPGVNGKPLCVQLLQLIQPVKNQWHAPIIQNKSRNRIEKTGFPQKAACCISEVLAKIAWGISNLFEDRAPAIDHRDKVLQIMACLKIHLAASPECFILVPRK
jgi:hypothetical protein